MKKSADARRKRPTTPRRTRRDGKRGERQTPAREPQARIFSGWLAGKLEGLRTNPTKLAARAGMSRSYLSMLLSAQRVPSYRKVLGLVRALNSDDLPAALTAAGLADPSNATPKPLPRDLSDRRGVSAVRRAEARTEEAVERRIVFDIALLAPGLTVEQLLCRILDNVAELIKFDYGNITLIDWDERQINVLAHRLSDKPAVYGRSEFTPTSWSVTEGITGEVARSGLPIRIADVRTVGARYLRHWANARSELAIPLKLHDTVIGVLNVESAEVDHFTDRDESLLLMIAPYLATAVGHARAYAQLEEWQERFSALARLHGKLLQSRDETDLLQDLAEGIATFRPVFDMCVVRSHDAEKGYILLRGAAHRHIKLRADKVGYLIPVSQSLSGAAVRQNRSIKYRDIQNDPQFHQRELAEMLGLHGMVAVPIQAAELHKPPIGCISVYTTSIDSRFQEEHVRLLEDIASFASVAISNRHNSLQLAALRDTSAICRDGTRGQGMFDRLCKLVCQHLGARGASLLLRPKSGDLLYLAGTTGIKGADDYTAVTYQLGEGKTGWIAKHGKPVRLVARDRDADERRRELDEYVGLSETHKFAEDVPPKADEHRHGFLGVPIISRNRVVGVIRAVGRHDGLAFTPTDQTILETIAFELGVALEGQGVTGRTSSQFATDDEPVRTD